MKEGDDEHDLLLCSCCFNLGPERLAQRAAERREAELVDFRERRARRMAELGLGSHYRETGAG